MKTRALFLLLSLPVILAGCAQDNMGAKEDQEVYFEVIHTNSAWVEKVEGFMIDKAGNIRTYANPAQWNEPDSSKGKLTLSQIKENISKTIISNEKVDANVLQSYSAKIAAVTDEQFTKPTAGGNDRGKTRYYAYKFDVEKQEYVAVLLSEKGNWERQNKNQAAMEISGWLTQIADKLK